MRAMTAREQEQHEDAILAVKGALSALRLTRLGPTDENIAVAMARLDEWLTENDGRWVK